LVEALRIAHLAPPPEVGHKVTDEPGGGVNKFVSLIGWQAGGIIAVKLVGVFPGNLDLAPPQPSVQGLVVVFDGLTGAPLLAADGAAMTFRKTAADSALGVRLLAREAAETLLVVGAGGLAPHVVAAHRSVRPSLRRVLVWNRTPERARHLARELAADAAGGSLDVRATEDLDAAVAAADIVSCVTMATTPLVKGALLRPGAHLDLIGAYLPDMREADDAAMRRGRIFVDTRSNMEGSGELTQPVAGGAITWDAVRGDLFELCNGRIEGRRSADDITIFKNVGGAHLDLFTAAHLFERLQAASPTPGPGGAAGAAPSRP
jgi:ornithine cyclodeaminase